MPIEIVVLSNDVVPGMGLPVAAPGLRAWGLAKGLRAHGYRVLLAVDDRVVKRVWDRPYPPPTPPGTIVLDVRQVGDLVRTRRPRAVVVTNANHVQTLGDLGPTRLVYDFFAPKVLEFEQNADIEARQGELQRLVERKLEALAKSAAVIVNGQKKLGYVAEWLSRASASDTPTAVVVMPVPPRRSSGGARPGPVQAVVSGYLQPWSRPGDWAQAVSPLLRDGSMVLHLLVTSHWGGEAKTHEMPETLARLVEIDGVQTHGAMEFEDFQRFLSSCDVSIDLFERNPERELAMVTRTMVAVASGLPTLHVPFTETSELVRQYDAGWLVEPTDLPGIEVALCEAVKSPAALEQKRLGAARMAAAIEPFEATKPLVDLLKDLPR